MSVSRHDPPKNEENIRILIVDDHPLVRESLKKLIQRQADLEVCGEAEDRNQALELAATTKPHLVIIDLTLKSSHGLELVKDIRSLYPKTQILVLSMHDELLQAERVIRAGAQGYISKQEPPMTILLAIRRILKGEIYWSEKAAALVASKIASARSSANSSVENLTDREMQVFELIGTGRSTRQIASTLHIDVSTVETYRARIKEKMNLKDGPELLRYAIRWANDPKI